jgi:photosystem II stability/assembly factor-like uncharacterized protein
MLVDPHRPGTVYANVGGGGIFKSSDGAMTWTRTDFAGQGIGQLLAIDPQNSNILYAAGTCCAPQAGFSLLKSTDGGVSWSPTGLKQFVSPLLIDPRDSNTLYARSGMVGGGVIKSTDGGTTWQTMNAGLGGTPNNVPNMFPLIIDPKNPDTLYGIRNNDNQMFRTSNGAESWDALTTGWDPALFHVVSLTADPKNAGTLYAATQEFDCGYYDVCPQNYYDRVKAAGGSGLFKSTDSGQSWVRLDAPPVGFVYFGNQALAIDAGNPSTLYFAPSSSGHVYRSTDGGASWSALEAPFPMTFVPALAVDGQTPSTLYAATQGSGVLAITFTAQ